MTRIAVTGSRKYTNRSLVHASLDSVRRQYPDMVLVVGFNPKDPKPQGLDQLAHEWAIAHKVTAYCYPADWDRYGNPAGPIRNRLMAISGLTKCIAFSGGKGTANMIEQCEKAGVPVERI